MHNLTLRFISLSLLLSCIANPAFAQQRVPEQRSEEPSWVSDSILIPLERDRAVRKLTYLLNEDFRRQPLKVRQQIVPTLNGAGIPYVSEEKLSDDYELLMRPRIEGWSTNFIRGKIHVELAKRLELEKLVEKRLAKLAKELAELQEEAEGCNAQRRVSNALDAIGYVVVEGRVMTKQQANPLFGITR